MSTSGGYLLEVAPGEYDAAEFERIAAEGRRALQAGRTADALALLRRAEELWRGPALVDVDLEGEARLQADRLDELRLAAIEDRIDLELASGAAPELVPELERLTAQHPLRERLRGQLMRALYSGGRQVEALEVFRRFRMHLADELGLEPAPELRRLERAILEHDLDAAPASEAAEPAPPPSARRRRSRLVALALALFGAAVAVAASVPLLARHSDRHNADPGPAMLRLAPDGGVSRRTALFGDPTAAVEGYGALWVVQRGDGLVLRVNPESGSVEATIRVGVAPSAVAAGEGDVWVTDGLRGTLARIDPSANTVTQTIHVGNGLAGVAVAGGGVWVAARADGKVVRVEPDTGRITASAATGVAPSALEPGGSVLWVANEGSGTIAAIDPVDGTIEDVIPVGVAPSALARREERLWVLDRLGATVSIVDPERRSLVRTIPLRGAPTALAASADAVWVAASEPARVLRLRPSDGAVTASVTLRGVPVALVGGSSVWAAVGASGIDHRGGTLRIAMPRGILDSIDPAASTSWNVAAPQLLGITNDGLVSLNHVAGPEGTRLVPNLAVALPRPLAGGRRYTFRLRPGIRFSTGALLRPIDVRHSFERLFDARSGGAGFFASIVGARQCLATSPPCTLNEGIAIDAATGTVTFHLERPDPEFLAKLTLSFAFVVPAGSPRSIQPRPLPGTGSYMIGTYRSRRRVVLVRNPFFREWSAAAQPAGYPDRITIDVVSAARGARLVESGRSDVMASVIPIPNVLRRSLLLHHPKLIRINPALATVFMFLNVNAPPFDDVRVRQAVNFAFDRRAAVAASGGPSSGAPTCQILPPGLPGYAAYCPYTRGSNTAGRWRGPDLVRARRLVAASGTKGMKVSVWDIEPSAGSLITVATLKRLGYRATLRLLPDERFYPFINDSRNGAQVIAGGWTTDYPSASDYIGKLSCAHTALESGTAAGDPGGFCDAAIDNQIARAAAVEARSPADAARLWARLDRQLTDLAVWIPLVTPTELDLLSSRTSNFQYHLVWGPIVDQLWVR